MSSTRSAEASSPSVSAKHEGFSSSLPPPSATALVAQWFKQLSGHLQESITVTPKFHEGITLKPLKVRVTETGRIVCSFHVPTHLTNSSQVLHQGVIASLVDNVGAAALVTVDGRVRLSVDMNISYISSAHVDDEIEVEAKVSKYTESLGVVLVTLTNRKTGQLVAQGRHTMYLPVSKL